MASLATLILEMTVDRACPSQGHIGCGTAAAYVPAWRRNPNCLAELGAANSAPSNLNAMVERLRMWTSWLRWVASFGIECRLASAGGTPSAHEPSSYNRST